MRIREGRDAGSRVAVRRGNRHATRRMLPEGTRREKEGGLCPAQGSKGVAGARPREERSHPNAGEGP